jgi:hypothetical protein
MTFLLLKRQRIQKKEVDEHYPTEKIGQYTRRHKQECSRTCPCMLIVERLDDFSDFHESRV